MDSNYETADGFYYCNNDCKYEDRYGFCKFVVWKPVPLDALCLRINIPNKKIPNNTISFIQNSIIMDKYGFK